MNEVKWHTKKQVNQMQNQISKHRSFTFKKLTHTYLNTNAHLCMIFFSHFSTCARRSTCIVKVVDVVTRYCDLIEFGKIKLAMNLCVFYNVINMNGRKATTLVYTVWSNEIIINPLLFSKFWIDIVGNQSIKAHFFDTLLLIVKFWSSTMR